MLKLRSGVILYKQKEGPVLFIETPDHRFYPSGGCWKRVLGSDDALAVSFGRSRDLHQLICEQEDCGGCGSDGSGHRGSRMDWHGA